MSLSSRIGLGRWMVFLALVLSLGVAGCGASKGTVSGKVWIFAASAGATCSGLYPSGRCTSST